MNSKVEKFEYVFVENNGIVRELDNKEKEYLNTVFEPFDGSRPYIKSSYKQLTIDNKLSGFLLRKDVPFDIPIITTNIRYLETRFPINIQDIGKIIHLPIGIYDIKLLGGWGASIGNFSLELKDLKTGIIIYPNKVNFKQQSHEFGERALKIMTLDIVKRGDYSIEFKNKKDIKLKYSNLIFMKLFESPKTISSLNIWIG